MFAHFVQTNFTLTFCKFLSENLGQAHLYSAMIQDKSLPPLSYLLSEQLLHTVFCHEVIEL